MNQINLLQPSCTEAEIEAVTEVLRSGWWGSGPKVAEFERKFTQYIGADGTVAVNSCTSALHLAVRLLLTMYGNNNKKPNIIVPSLTFVSTGLVGLYEDVEVRFADVNEETLCMDVESVKKLFDLNTIAIIPVHYGGVTAPTKELVEIFGRHKVIEDCAHATGNPDAGKQGVMSCWSFHPVKNLATGDMGAITYKDLPPHMVDILIQERWCGINLDTYKREKGGYNWEYNIRRMGYKYNTNDIMAALGLVQLNRIWELNGKRQLIADRYNNELKDLPITLMPKSGSNHLYVIRVPSYLRNKLVEHMRDNKVSPGVHYKPIHTYPIWDKFGEKRIHNLPVTEKVAEEIITLPIHPEITFEDQTRVINTVREFFSINA